MKKLLFCAMIVAGGCAQLGDKSHSSSAAADPQFAKLADEYINGYLEWRPQTGTSLGLHRYDGKVTDFSRASLDAELARLKSFDRRLDAVDRASLGASEAYDYRILQNAVKREIFAFEDWQIYTQNPMT